MSRSTTTPCGKCGATDRNASGKCRPCQSERSKRWNLENAEKSRRQQADAYQANKELVKKRSAEWYAANKKRASESSRARYLRDPAGKALAARNWIKANPDRAKIIFARSFANRKARLNSSGHQISKGVVARLYKLQKGKCACCMQPLGKDFQLDHIFPLALGGANADWNVQLLKRRCNATKAAKHPIDFMQSKGYLL